MRNMAIVGLPTYELSNLTSGISPPAGMPLSNLDKPELWRATRLPTGDAAKLWVRGQLIPRDPYGDLLDRPAAGQHVGGVALAGHNLAPGSEWRVLLGSSAIAIPSAERVLPNSVSLSGFSGTAADIDDDPYNSTADALECDASPSTTLAADISFATPANAPTGEQRSRIKIEYDLGGINLVSVTMQVYDGINLLASWAAGDWGGDIPPSGTVVEIPWSAGDLTTTDGSAVLLRFQLTKTGTPTAGAFKIIACDWHSPYSTPSGVLYDSDWLTATEVDPSTPWGLTSPLSVGLPPSQTSVHILPGGVEIPATHFLVMLTNPFDQLGYVDIGRLVFGPCFMPGINRDWGALVSLNGRDVVVESEGGGAYGVRRRPMREMPIPLPWLTDAEWVELFERAWRAGQLDPFVVSLVESGVETRHLNLYVRWKTLPKIEWNREFPDYREFGAEVVETR